MGEGHGGRYADTQLFMSFSPVLDPSPWNGDAHC